MSFLYFYMPYVIIIYVDSLKNFKCLYPLVNYVTYLLIALVGVHFLFWLQLNDGQLILRIFLDPVMIHRAYISMFANIER